jgi:hypothetical protein
MGSEFKKAVVQSLMHIGLLVLLYLGWHILYEGGDVVRGFQMAFLDTRLTAASRAQEGKVTTQAELEAVANTDKVINQLLAGLLDKSPTAARVRLAQIHNGVSGITGISLLKFDLTHAAAAVGRSTGQLLPNQPLSEWTEYLQVLLAGRCVLIKLQDLVSPVLRGKMVESRLNAFLGCPVVDAANQMLGGVFISWDDGDALPTGDALRQLTEESRIVGRQLGAALGLRAVRSR